MGESIERQAAEIRKRLAFLKMIEQVLATNVPAAAKKRTLELGYEAGSRNCLKYLAMIKINMARCRVSPGTRRSQPDQSAGAFRQFRKFCRVELR